MTTPATPTVEQLERMSSFLKSAMTHCRHTQASGISELLGPLAAFLRSLKQQREAKESFVSKANQLSDADLQQIDDYYRDPEPQPTSEPAEEFWRVIEDLLSRFKFVRFTMKYATGTAGLLLVLEPEDGEPVMESARTLPAVKAALLAELRRKGEIE